MKTKKEVMETYCRRATGARWLHELRMESDHGRFIDMLRYDEAWLSGSDSVDACLSGGQFTVLKYSRFKDPARVWTLERWASFGCRPVMREAPPTKAEMRAMRAEVAAARREFLSAHRTFKKGGAR